MKNLLYKELRLCLTPQAIIFGCLSVLIVIPGWPSLIAFIYTFVGFFVIFPVAIANRDLEFTAILPIRKRDLATGKTLLGMIFELGSVILSIPFALIKAFLINPNLPAEQSYTELGINFALYGIVLGLCGIFNLIFLWLYYKSPYKTVKAQIFAALGIIVLITLIMAYFMIDKNATTVVNTYTGLGLLTQLLILGGGLALFVAMSYLAARLAGKRLESIDL